MSSAAVTRRSEDSHARDPLTSHGAAAPWLLWAAIALGAILRLFRLGHQPLWLDESFTWKAAELLNEAGINEVIALDHIAPGYYWLAAMFARIGGYGAGTLRLPSALAGVVAIWLVHRLVLSVTRRSALALAAACFMAVSPFAISYSQEARGYSVLMALSVAYLWLHWLVVEERACWGRLVGLALVGGVMLWFHHAAAFVFVGTGLHVLWRHRLSRISWQWLGCHLCALALFAPWIVLSWAKLNQASDLPRPEIWSRMPYNAMSMLVAQSFGPSNREIRELGIAAAVKSSLLPLGMLGLCGILALWSLWRGRSRLGRRQWDFLAAVLLGTNLALLLSVLATHNLYHVRYLVTCFPVIVLLVALAVTPWKDRLPRAVGCLTLLVALWADANYYFVSSYAKEDFRQAPAVLAMTMSEEDTLLLGNRNAVPPLEPYGFTCPARAIELRSGKGVNSLEDFAVDHSEGADTFTVETRQWEVVSSSEIDRVLDDVLGPPVHVWEWDGVRMTQRHGSLTPRSADGLALGCEP